MKTTFAFAASHQVTGLRVWLAAAGFLFALPVSSLAQNLVVNGNFTNNAAGFVTWPGYVGSGGNPINVPGWTQVSGSTNGYGVNGAGTVTTVFGPANTASNTFFFHPGFPHQGTRTKSPGGGNEHHLHVKFPGGSS